MSRIGKQPIILPDGVTAKVADLKEITVKGPLGNISYSAHPDIKVELIDNRLICSVARTTKKSSALWGTTRARLANIVKGVSEGFSKQLELQGVGYRAKLIGKDLELNLGFSHTIQVPAPAGITFTVENEIITVTGNDIIQVGQVAADIRARRKPEPYKGKGVRYVGEHVRRKVGKVVSATAE